MVCVLDIDLHNVELANVFINSIAVNPADITENIAPIAYVSTQAATPQTLSATIASGAASLYEHFATT